MAGFRSVTRGVIGDELVAAEYLKVWGEEPWGTLIRSTDPVVVDTIRLRYPELVPYLAPIAIPAVAEARYLRAQYGPGLKIAYAGLCPPLDSNELDAAISFSDLDQIFRLRGGSVLASNSRRQNSSSRGPDNGWSSDPSVLRMSTNPRSSRSTVTARATASSASSPRSFRNRRLE